MQLDLAPDEWLLVRQLVSRGCAHLGGELQRAGSQGALAVAEHLRVAAKLEAQLEAQLEAAAQGQSGLRVVDTAGDAA